MTHLNRASITSAYNARGVASHIRGVTFTQSVAMPAAWTLLVIFTHLWHGSQSNSGKLRNSVTLAHHEELHVFGMKSFRFLFPVRFPFIFYLPYFKRAT